MDNLVGLLTNLEDADYQLLNILILLGCLTVI